MKLLVIAAGLWVLSVIPTAAEAPCTCAEAKARMGWCAAHEVGHVAGVEIRSAELFEALDAHGHEIEPRFIECETCLQARETDGFCEEHHMGFVDQLAWLSTLTYQLAKGRLRAPKELTCPVCRENSASHGWCSACGKGMVSLVEISSREDYETLLRARRVLIEARKTVIRCELCAAAMVSDGRCPICKIAYENGKPVKSPP